MKEITDPKTGAILFKKDEKELLAKKVSLLERKINKLELNIQELTKIINEISKK